MRNWGGVRHLGTDLLVTREKLRDNNFWATYSSAQEVVCDKFQPSGLDYIIHVLGDEQRAKYLQEFKTENFEYVATINPKFTDWEFWIERANWFFYRKLYENWHPEFANNYEVFWSRNASGESYVFGSDTNDGAIKTQIMEIDENTKKIVITCPSNVNGIADVFVDYEVHQTSQFILNFRQLLFIKNTGYKCAKNPDYHERNYLRAISKEFIPIVVHNGYGEVTLTSKPEECTSLELKECYCNRIYTNTAHFGIVEELYLSGL